MRGHAIRRLGVAGMALTLAACATTMAAKPPSLYERLGAREGIRAVVDDFVATAAAGGGAPARRRERLRFSAGHPLRPYADAARRRERRRTC